MAKKGNSAKFFEEARNPAPVEKQKAPPSGNALYLMQLRPHGLKISVSRQRLHVTVQRDAKAEEPQPIKITHAG